MPLVQHGDERPGRSRSAGASGNPWKDRATRAGAPRVVVFDSGLGGLTVLEAIVASVPEAELVFAADDAVFPYGRLSEADLVARVMAVMERLVAMTAPDVVVIACNTASTLVLPPLRARFTDLAIVGTVRRSSPPRCCREAA